MTLLKVLVGPLQVTSIRTVVLTWPHVQITWERGSQVPGGSGVFLKLPKDANTSGGWRAPGFGPRGCNVQSWGGRRWKPGRNGAGLGEGRPPPPTHTREPPPHRRSPTTVREGGEGEKQRSESLACLPFAWQSCEERTRRAGLGAGRGRARSSSRARFPSPPLAFAGAGQAEDEQTGLSESGRNDPAVNRSTHFAPGPQAPSSPAVLPSGPPAPSSPASSPALLGTPPPFP